MCTTNTFHKIKSLSDNLSIPTVCYNLWHKKLNMSFWLPTGGFCIINIHNLKLTTIMQPSCTNLTWATLDFIMRFKVGSREFLWPALVKKTLQCTYLWKQYPNYCIKVLWVIAIPLKFDRITLTLFHAIFSKISICSQLHFSNRCETLMMLKIE